MKKIIPVILCLAAPLMLTSCSKSVEDQIIGKWKYSTEIALPDDGDVKNAKMRLECDDEFFPNKSLTHDCKFLVNADTVSPDGQPAKFDIAGGLRATGEWSVNKESVYDKTVDGKVELESFKVNGEKIDDEKILAGLRESLANPFMKGETSVMKTVSIGKDQWVFEEEIEKKKVTITATRR